jgi:hypothetical protein
MEFDDFSCYYCTSTYSVYGELISHLGETHPDLNIKYRQRELDHETGRIGFRTKFYPDCSPWNKTITVTADNRLSVTNVDRYKRGKNNTPQKAKTFSGEMESDSASQFGSLDINMSTEDNSL